MGGNKGGLPLLVVLFWWVFSRRRGEVYMVLLCRLVYCAEGARGEANAMPEFGVRADAGTNVPTWEMELAVRQVK